jgi:hypothetical protein
MDQRHKLPQEIAANAAPGTFGGTEGGREPQVTRCVKLRRVFAPRADEPWRALDG